MESYRWDVGARLMSMRCNLSPEPVIFDYDGMCNLVRADYSMHESIFRTPDKVGNLYRSESGRDRTYDGGGRLTSNGEFPLPLRLRGEPRTQKPQEPV